MILGVNGSQWADNLLFRIFLSFMAGQKYSNLGNKVTFLLLRPSITLANLGGNLNFRMGPGKTLVVA